MSYFNRGLQPERPDGSYFNLNAAATKKATLPNTSAPFKPPASAQPAGSSKAAGKQTIAGGGKAAAVQQAQAGSGKAAAAKGSKAARGVSGRAKRGKSGWSH